MENFRGFRGLVSNREGFQRIFLSIIRCFELLYNRESFPANNKIMQPRNFSTVKDLHYMVLYWNKLLFQDVDLLSHFHNDLVSNAWNYAEHLQEILNRIMHHNKSS